MSLWYRVKKWLDKQPSSPGLIQAGLWRVRYPDGSRTMWFTYDCACNYREIFGGEIEYQPDVAQARP